MALFRKTLTRHADPDTGKRVKAGTPGAVTKRGKSAKWYGRFRDADGVLRTVPLARDKAAARSMLADLERDADRGRAGLSDPFAEHARTPLSDHADAFGRHLAAKGNTDQHVRGTLARVRGALIDGCGFRLPGDLSASRLAEHLADQRAADVFGVATSNHYLTACKMFARWMVKDRRAADDPLAHLSRLNADADVRKERRDLPPAELAAVFDAAGRGPERGKLCGRDRRMLYVTAAYTGLRASELASLTRRSFDLGNPDGPTVTVEAGYSKHRRRDVLPVHPDLADRLGEWFAERDRDARDRAGRERADAPAVLRIDAAPVAADSDAGRLWPGRWNAHAAEMLRGDLADAGVPYTDADGRDFDFHALRHQFITTLARSGVHPKDAQALARHSTITLTMDRYTHVGLRDMGAAVAALPGLPTTPTVARATGTDAADADPRTDRTAKDSPCNRTAEAGDVVAPRVALMVALPGGDGREQTGTTGETSTCERRPAGPAPRIKKPPDSQGVGDDRGRSGTPEQDCRRRDSNPHGGRPPKDFESFASAIPPLRRVAPPRHRTRAGWGVVRGLYAGCGGMPSERREIGAGRSGSGRGRRVAGGADAPAGRSAGRRTTDHSPRCTTRAPADQVAAPAVVADEPADPRVAGPEGRLRTRRPSGTWWRHNKLRVRNTIAAARRCRRRAGRIRSSAPASTASRAGSTAAGRPEYPSASRMRRTPADGGTGSRGCSKVRSRRPISTPPHGRPRTER